MTDGIKVHEMQSSADCRQLHTRPSYKFTTAVPHARNQLSADILLWSI